MKPTIEQRYTDLMSQPDLSEEDVRSQLIQTFGANPVVEFFTRKALEHKRHLEKQERQSGKGNY